MTCPPRRHKPYNFSLPIVQFYLFLQLPTRKNRIVLPHRQLHRVASRTAAKIVIVAVTAATRAAEVTASGAMTPTSAISVGAIAARRMVAMALDLEADVSTAATTTDALAVTNVAVEMIAGRNSRGTSVGRSRQGMITGEEAEEEVISQTKCLWFRFVYTRFCFILKLPFRFHL